MGFFHMTHSLSDVCGKRETERESEREASRLLPKRIFSIFIFIVAAAAAAAAFLVGANCHRCGANCVYERECVYPCACVCVCVVCMCVCPCVFLLWKGVSFLPAAALLLQFLRAAAPPLFSCLLHALVRCVLFFNKRLLQAQQKLKKSPMCVCVCVCAST